MRKCPQCGSRKARPAHRRELERWIAALQIRPFRCRKCHQRFWWLDPLSLRSTGFGPLLPVILALAAAAGVALYMAGLPYAGEVPAAPPSAGVAAGVPAAGVPAAGVPAAGVPAAGVPAAGNAGERTPAANEERRFAGVEVVEAGDERLRLKIETDRPPTAWSHFFLARPPRFAIDLEGRWLLPRSTSTFLNHPLVQRVRADRHEGALRVAIELGPARSAEPTFEEAADGLIVTFRRIPD